MYKIDIIISCPGGIRETDDAGTGKEAGVYRILERRYYAQRR